jgi:spermidine/putrescine transport system permease protein
VVRPGVPRLPDPDALTTTLQVALEVTLVSTIVGTAAAFPLVRSRLPFRSGIRIG